jgi:hypothetical protein
LANKSLGPRFQKCWIRAWCSNDSGAIFTQKILRLRVFWSLAPIRTFKMCIASPILVTGSVNGSQNVYCVSDYCQRLWHMYSSILSESRWSDVKWHLYILPGSKWFKNVNFFSFFCLFVIFDERSVKYYAAEKIISDAFSYSENV